MTNHSNRPTAAIDECKAICQGAENDRALGVEPGHRWISTDRVAELLAHIDRLEGRLAPWG